MDENSETVPVDAVSSAAAGGVNEALLALDGAPLALDGGQRAVIALPEKASGIVAGAPGTGKTTTLIRRVQALAHAGLHPDRMLVLTPTRRGAARLRDALGLAVGGATSGPIAHSVASFAFRIVRVAAAVAGEEAPRLLTGGDEDRIIGDLLAGDAEDEMAAPSRWPEWLTAEIRSTRAFRAEVRAFLAQCITEGIGPVRLQAAAAGQQVEVWTAMASFYQEYTAVRAQMRAAHRDAAGLVYEAAAMLRASQPAAHDPLAGMRAVLVDDAQELTAGGIDLLTACHARGIPVLAFGDPDVSAGAFRGASPENFARLAGTLGRMYVLGTPHRGTPQMVDLVRRVTSHIGAAGTVAHRRPPRTVDQGPADGTGVTDTGEAASVRCVLAGSHAEEVDVIARALRDRHLRGGVDWDQCVVIAHDTRQVAALEAELIAREVPARAQGASHTLGELRAARDLLRAVELGATDPEEWTQETVEDALLGAVGGFDPVQLRRLRTALRHEELRSGGERSGAQLLVDGCRHPVEFDVLDTPQARRAARLARCLASVREGLVASDSAHELLWRVWEGAHMQAGWVQAAAGTGPLSEQAGRDLDAVVALFQAAKRFDERDDADAANPLVFVRDVLHSDVAQDRLEQAPRRAAVAVLTPAGALGLEADTVVIAGVQEDVWPNTRPRGGLLDTWRLAQITADDAGTAATDRRMDAMHDELRLFVRALSRARSRVLVTAVKDDDNAPSVFFELLPEPDPAGARDEHPLSLRGLVAAHRRTLTATHPGPEAPARAAARAHAAGQLALLADAGVDGADPAQWYGVAAPTSTAGLRASDEDVYVSPSRLQALETCQLDWVIAELGGDIGGASAGLGTIIHAVLERSEGKDERELQDDVFSRWDQLDFAAPWLDEAARRRARDLVHRLHLYLRRFEASGGSLIQAEPHFEVPVPDAPASDVPAREAPVPDVDQPAAGREAEQGRPVGNPQNPRNGKAHVSGYIDRVERTAQGRIVIVDLKTGGHEPQTDRAVADNPQLAAYQLAFEHGAIPGAAGMPSGGAKLLVLRPTAESKDYAEPMQPPFDDATRAAFLERVRQAVEVMRSAEFTAPYELHCRNEHTHGLCRIHTIPAVSAP